MRERATQNRGELRVVRYIDSYSSIFQNFHYKHSIAHTPAYR